jgi:hypothetical protein
VQNATANSTAADAPSEWDLRASTLQLILTEFSGDENVHTASIRLWHLCTISSECKSQYCTKNK